MRRIRDLFWGRSGYYALGPAPEGWNRRYLSVLEVLPFVTLGLATLLSQLQPYPREADRLLVVGLAVLAAIWILVFYNWRRPQWRQPTGLMLVYFVGLLILGWPLEARSTFFIAFVIVGFLQAPIIFPAGLAALATAATSCVIYLAPSGSQWTEPRNWPGLAFLVLLQTAAVTGGNYVTVRIMEEQEQRKKMVADLESAMKENAGLQAQLVVQAREAGMLDERQRLAAEIHDTLAQGLAGIITQLEAAEGMQRNGAEWRNHFEKAQTLARQSLSEARRSVQALRPGELENSRLHDAINRLTKEWSATTGVTVPVQMVGQPVPLRPEVEVTMFRVAQEALANIAKHAHASRVELTVSYLGDVVRLDVRDDGVGFDVAVAAAEDRADGNGYGLSAMRQRLRRMGGEIDIESSPHGTAISASVPTSPDANS
jgi:signal transduction histidine kinase